MSVESDHHGSGTVSRPLDPFASRWSWKGGMVAGLVATVVMGLAISSMRLDTLQLAIAGLYASEGSLAIGWAAHLVHGTVFGGVFAAILSDPGLFRLTRWRWKTLVAGIVYGLVLAIVGAGIIMPVWLGVVGFPRPPTLPNVTLPLLAWHVLYGAVLGVVYPVVEGW